MQSLLEGKQGCHTSTFSKCSAQRLFGTKHWAPRARYCNDLPYFDLSTPRLPSWPSFCCIQLKQCDLSSAGVCKLTFLPERMCTQAMASSVHMRRRLHTLRWAGLRASPRAVHATQAHLPTEYSRTNFPDIQAPSARFQQMPRRC